MAVLHQYADLLGAVPVGIFDSEAHTSNLWVHMEPSTRHAESEIEVISLGSLLEFMTKIVLCRKMDSK